MIVCAGNNESFSFATSIGVGLVNSAINLTKLLTCKSAKNIVFVGSAGSYGKLNIFDIFTSKKAVNIEIGFLENLSYSPIFGDYNIENSIVSHETLDNFVINSSSFITCDKNQSNLFLHKNLDAENMEFFSILKVAEKFNIPAFGIFCITNYCFSNAHEEFKKNHNNAKKILEHEILNKYKDYIE